MREELDLKVRFIKKTGPSSSPYALAEFDNNGQQVGEDQIPYNWGVHFTASKLTLCETLTHDGSDFSFILDENPRIPFSREVSLEAENVIIGNLRQGTFTTQGFEEDFVSYFFFGSSDPISNIGIEIREAEQERCPHQSSHSYPTP